MTVACVHAEMPAHSVMSVHWPHIERVSLIFTRSLLQPETTLANNSVQSDKRIVHYQLFICRICSFETGAHCVTQVCLERVSPRFPEPWTVTPSFFYLFCEGGTFWKIPTRSHPLNSQAVGHMIATRLRHWQGTHGMAGID